MAAWKWRPSKLNGDPKACESETEVWARLEEYPHNSIQDERTFHGRRNSVGEPEARYGRDAGTFVP